MVTKKNQLDLAKKRELGKQAKELAYKQRKEWELGIEPIPDIFTLLEDKGILLARFPSENCDLSGFAMKMWGRSCIYINSEHVLGRQIFSIGHELCHLIHDLNKETIKVCFQSEEESEIDEYRAYRFAADFLVPEEKLTEICLSMVGRTGKIDDVRKVIELQHIFNVSFSAMLYRLLANRLIWKSFYDEAKTLSQLSRIEDFHRLTKEAGYSTSLIVKTGPYIPASFIDILNKNYHDGLITWEKFQSILDLVNSDAVGREETGGEP